jgi:dipeptidyl aminopeptidase/acylaminoacyl peptidase
MDATDSSPGPLGVGTHGRHWPRPVGLLLAALLLTASPSTAQTPAPGPGFTVKRAFGIGDVESVELRDASGATKTITASSEVSTQDGLQRVTEVSFLPATRFLLEIDSNRRETDVDTRRRTGKLTEIANRLTLYDRRGRALFTTTVGWIPIGLSETGKTLCILTPPEYWEGPPADDAISPATDHLVVLSKRGEILREVDEPRWSVKSPRISPSGRWIAYGKELGRLSNQIVLLNLASGRRVETPPTDDRSLLGFDAVLDDGNLVTFQETLERGPDGGWMKRRSAPQVLYRMEAQ